MSYSSSIPNASDPRALSQRQILANFQSINSVWAVNHSSLTGNATQGQHDVLTIRPQTTDPTTSANQVALYNKTVSSIPELFFRPPSNATPIQLTSPTVSVSSSETPTTRTFDQVSFVAGPFIVYAGFRTNTTGITNGTVINVSPTSNLIYANVNQSGAGSIGGVTTGVVATSVNSPIGSFTVKFVNNPSVIIPILYYIAIGH